MTEPTNPKPDPLSIYFVIGEMSGDSLGADLLSGFKKIDLDVVPIGLGGEKMAANGLDTLFDISELSVMGLSGVVAKFPRLLTLVRKTAADIIARQPDGVILIDSPEFAFAVAKRVRAHSPHIPIIKYVCPSVWAWRPGRARKLRPFLDHILAILPFEPAVLKELDGPPATYVGHPLAQLLEETETLDKTHPAPTPVLALCPGSRKSEVTRILPIMRETLEILKDRNIPFEVELPAVPHLESLIQESIATWKIQPKLVRGEDARRALFKRADVALAASGTVTLELAIHKVPLVSTYKLDRLMRLLEPFVHGWTASLPNLIADMAFIPEKFNKYANSQNIARTLEQLMVSGPARDAQLAGFEQMANNMRVEREPGVTAALTIKEVIALRRTDGSKAD